MKINTIIPKINIYKKNPIKQEKNDILTLLKPLSCDTFSSSFKENKKETQDSNIEKLTNLGVDKLIALKYRNLNQEDLNKLILAIEHGATHYEFDEILKLSDEEFENYIKIRQECDDISYGITIAKLDKKQFQRAQTLLNLGMNVRQAYIFPGASDDKFEKIKKIATCGGLELSIYKHDEKNLARYQQLLSLGIDPSLINRYLSYDDEQFSKALEFHKYSPDSRLWQSYAYLSHFKEAIKYIKQGLNPYNIPDILTWEAQKEYKELNNKIHNPRIASMFIGLGAQGFFEIEDIAKLIKNIDTSPKNQTSKLREDILCQLADEDIDIKKFNSYIESFDRSKLINLAPIMKNFEPNQMFDFFFHHYKQNNDVLDPKNLIKEDIESELKKRLYDSEDLRKIFTLYPLTKKEIGEIPETWLDKLSKEEKENAKNTINEAILAFIKSKDKEKLADTLSKTLQKETKITGLPTGAFGKCYRLQIEGTIDSCLKIFKKSFERGIQHGAGFEPQAALFANEHSDKFVKMFFGRMTDKNYDEAYLVTQFLAPGIKPIETKASGQFEVRSEDASNNHNIIHGKIIDFGAIEASRIFDKNWQRLNPYN